MNRKIRNTVKNRPYKKVKGGYGLCDSYYYKYQYHDYFLDVWSNIHYVFLGRFCGFTAKGLIAGSDFQQFLSNLKNFNFKGDDPADKITMQLFIYLYDKYINNLKDLNYQVILDNLESLNSVGGSRLLHKCYDTSSTGVTAI